jgi:hypothetical protein
MNSLVVRFEQFGVCYEQFAVTEPPSPPWGEAKKMATYKQAKWRYCKGTRPEEKQSS